MRMSIVLEAILPKKYHTAAKAKKAVDKLLLRWQVEAQRQLKRYPPQQPTDYVRTGNLGRNWSGYTLKSGESIEMANPVPYAVWVQGPSDGSGPGQRDIMAAKGWASVTTVAEDAMKVALRKEGMWAEEFD